MLTRASRGQVFPVWTIGALAMLVVCFFAIDYATVVRWQVRAQNAADAAAAAAASVQATQWNEMTATLYAAGIEEHRIRFLINGLRATARNSGGCAVNALTAEPQPLCDLQYAALRVEYDKAVARYGNLVSTMQAIANASHWDQVTGDMRAVVAGVANNCAQGGASNGGDCSFAYSVSDVSPRTNGLQDVTMDASGWTIGNQTVGTPSQDLTPARIEIVTCHVVQAPLPNVFGLQWPAFKAIGRAAATPIMMTSEWMQPGQITNPDTGKPFQPAESYRVAGLGAPNGIDWYGVDFGGNSAKAWWPKYAAYSESVSTNEYSAATGWWGAVPIVPYAGALDPANIPCS